MRSARVAIGMEKSSEMGSTQIIKHNGPTEIQRGVVAREDFGSQQLQSQAETSANAVAAREKAKIEAAYVMAERHPRMWDSVRVNILAHCARPRFAETAMYRKPVGKKQINGQWQEQFVEGLSARFAETAMQEMGNLMPEASVVYEDDLLRIVRASVIDLEKNVIQAQEIPVAKAVERKGRKDRSGEWGPPDGREVLSSRLNSYGDPVFLVRATDDELKNKQNSDISKAQRNFILKLLPRDIAEEAIDLIRATLADPKKTDPTAARKRLIDAFAVIGVHPEDLVSYVGVQLDRISPAQLGELRGLYTAVRDGETTFDAALKLKYAAPVDAEESDQDRDIRLQRQMEQQEHAARTKDPGPPSEEEMKAADLAAAAAEEQARGDAQPPKPTFAMPKRKS